MVQFKNKSNASNPSDASQLHDQNIENIRNEQASMSREEKSSTGEGLPNKTVQSGPQRSQQTLGPGNDGQGGDYYQRLQEKRSSDLGKSLHYQKQFPKSSLGEKIKSWFS
ncbi:1799_t:CDS:1 [Funneliformis geosporum]|uniref:12228_t:CDS:1 n=1 Tax=Funneliformis geosporum TaxID=1117311 RepID=A0A9W4SYM5_9GLOM|nr:1799_t:CDS:1 [Funneliformis geosporum]CAI2185635.1 12228_t:CDS:1 [Funneliformis geosporum]